MARREIISDPNIYRIYRATFALGFAYGMAISLISVFLDQRGLEKSEIGTLATWFAAGIVTFSLPMGAIIGRFSAKATLIAALFGYALTVTAMPYLHSYWAIAAVRFIDGACSVGVWISSETILLHRAGSKHKAHVTSLYAVTVALGYLVGPLAARGLVMIAPFAAAFTVAGVVAALAGAYVALRLDRDSVTYGDDEDSAAATALHAANAATGVPAVASASASALGAASATTSVPTVAGAATAVLPETNTSGLSAVTGAATAVLPETNTSGMSAVTGAATAVLSVATPAAPSRFGQIIWAIKTCCYATFAYGYFQSSVVLFLPLYLIEHKGVATEQTILIPAFFAAGMLLFANFGGKIGDRLGHLGTMRRLAVIGTSTILGFVYLGSFTWMALAVFIAGATLATISPLSLALQGVIVDKQDYARSNSLYNSFYAAGMLLGPPISSMLFVRFGGATMLFHLAAIWAGFVVFATAYRRDDPAATREGTPTCALPVAADADIEAAATVGVEGA